VSLLSRAKRYQWKDCEELVITKSWLGGKKTKASINPEKVVQILYDNGAPGDVLQGAFSLSKFGTNLPTLTAKQF
jgi:hypothetical protein